MTEDSQHRCFIGVPVTAGQLGRVRALRQTVLRGVRARPVPEANLHMTLVFLGNLVPAQVCAVASVIEALEVSPVPGVQPMQRLGGFPGPASRILALQGKATPALASLVRDLRFRLANEGLPNGDDRPLRPHITLAKRPRGGKALPDEVCELPLPVDQVVLYESVPVLTGNGVEYHPLARRNLG